MRNIFAQHRSLAASTVVRPRAAAVAQLRCLARTLCTSYNCFMAPLTAAAFWGSVRFPLLRVLSHARLASHISNRNGKHFYSIYAATHCCWFRYTWHARRKCNRPFGARSLRRSYQSNLKGRQGCGYATNNAKPRTPLHTHYAYHIVDILAAIDDSFFRMPARIDGFGSIVANTSGSLVVTSYIYDMGGRFRRITSP